MLKVFVLGMRGSLPDGSLPAKEAPRPAVPAAVTRAPASSFSRSSWQWCVSTAVAAVTVRRRGLVTSGEN